MDLQKSFSMSRVNVAGTRWQLSNFWIEKSMSWSCKNVGEMKFLDYLEVRVSTYLFSVAIDNNLKIL